MHILYPEIHNAQELYDAVKQLEETSFPKLYREVILKVGNLNVEKVRDYLAKHLGDKVGSNDNIYFLDRTMHWVYVDDNNVVAFEDTDENTLYIFSTVEYLLKFVHNNAWTFDKIVDFESKSTVYYEVDQFTDEMLASHMVVGNVTQDDAEALYDLVVELTEGYM